MCEVNNNLLPKNLRPAKPEDIILDAEIWHHNDEGDLFKNHVKHIIDPSDPYKAYHAEDACRYGLDDAYIEIKMITKEQVNEAKENYFNLLEQYHKENNTIIRLKRAPDGYRGDYSCLEFIDEIKCKITKDGGCPNVYEVTKNHIKIGILKQWYGNNGRGKLAAEEFYPDKGIKVEWQ